MASCSTSVTNPNLLTAALSALSGQRITGISQESDVNAISVFDDHHFSFSYGLVGNADDYKCKSSSRSAGSHQNYASSNTLIRVVVRSLTGKSTPIDIPARSMVRALKVQIQDKEGIPPDVQRLVFSGMQMEDGHTLEHYGVTDHSTIHIVLKLRGGGPEDPLKLDISCLDPKYDYDFTNKTDRKRSFSRGRERYRRPCGWKRTAIKVSRKFEDDVWLGKTNAYGEWPVSYHGTGRNQAKSIAEAGYDLTKGKRFKFGYGIYTTPDIHIAEKYAIRFSHENEDYLVVMQNRVNPDTLVKIDKEETGVGEYWISPTKDDIRPYGICIRKA